MDDPNRAKDLREIDDPKELKSKIDRAEAILEKLRKERLEPRCTTSITDKE